MLCDSWKSHSNYPPFPEKHASQPLTIENPDFQNNKISLSPLKIFTCHLQIHMPKYEFANMLSCLQAMVLPFVQLPSYGFQF